MSFPVGALQGWDEAAGRNSSGGSGYGHLVTSYSHPGTFLTDHVFLVPLDHGRPDGDQIEVYAREVAAVGKADADLPWLLFLQGGPGVAAQRPVGREAWLDRALDDYRVLLLDQRGTGSHQLHYLLESAFTAGELSDAFRYEVQTKLGFAAAPLYVLLHEACYAQGAATGWSAQRIREEAQPHTTPRRFVLYIPVFRAVILPPRGNSGSRGR